LREKEEESLPYRQSYLRKIQKSLEMCKVWAVILTFINTKLSLVKFHHFLRVFSSKGTTFNAFSKSETWNQILEKYFSVVVLMYLRESASRNKATVHALRISVMLNKKNDTFLFRLFRFFFFFFFFPPSLYCFLDLSFSFKCRIRTICFCLSLSSCFIQQLMVKLLSLLAPFAIVETGSNGVAREVDQVRTKEGLNHGGKKVVERSCRRRCVVQKKSKPKLTTIK
jgi:hypothetical protein